MKRIMNLKIVPLFLFFLSTACFERGAGFWTNPADEGSHNFFTALTYPKSQREDWYKVTPYCAEFWCAISNIGFMCIGIHHQSPELILAGTASFVSHSIPKQWLLMIDKLGVALVFSKIIREHQVLVDHPWLLAPVAAAVAVNIADTYLARKKGVTLPHVIWHLTAAYSAHLFLQAIHKKL